MHGACLHMSGAVVLLHCGTSARGTVPNTQYTRTDACTRTSLPPWRPLAGPSIKCPRTRDELWLHRTTGHARYITVALYSCVIFI